ncbi:uncharacterized protein N7479_008629 [Penicillium vulpinum]|uniref:Uncharacterized protein n=1 Tax=Penicillium vulpinum TaxID=29845 RepID=A0A1V6S1S7_9EURO|nr:uncharacterized protein N7479_008629 [Penicillium vulpinum]KAJ5950216.1 hypothetical protein N7479_008629 [Penicillium vulpinum]OQE07699.1 hypothetical protein PENVUL_c012G00144 [Penicillium vulpinum]
MKGNQQQKDGNDCAPSDYDYHNCQTHNFDNAQNKPGNCQVEGNVPAPACVEQEISQSEAVDYGRYTAIQPADLPKQNDIPDIASSTPGLNNFNIFDAIINETPTFSLDPGPGICSSCAHPRASKDLEAYQEQVPERTMQHRRQFYQQKFTVSPASLAAIDLSTGRITRTNLSTTRSPTPLPGTPESLESVYISENKGKTALHISVERGNLGIVRLLLLYGVEVNRRDKLGRTALHYAACGAHIEIATELLIAGADPEARDNEGRSPLHAAADAECEPMIRLLVREGADLNAAIGISGSSSSERDYMPG